MEEYSIGQKIGRGRFYGVYPSVDEVPSFGINLCDDEKYCEYFREIVVRESFQEGIKKRRLRGLMNGFSYYFTILPVIKSIIAEKGKVTIVDFGGGQGENYIFMERFFQHECMEYHVVEQEKNCMYGRALQLPGNISFHVNAGCQPGCFLNEEAKSILERADICLLIGVVEFCFPYENLLNQIAGTGVEYIFMTRTTINQIADTFYTRQYVAPIGGEYQDIVLGDSVLGVINYKELTDTMCNAGSGYDLLIDLFQQKDFMESESLPYPYDQIEYRDMIFRSKGAGSQ